MKDFPLYRSARGAVLTVLLTAGPVLAFAYAPYLSLYVPIWTLFLLPVLTCLAGTVGGALPMAVDAGVGLYALYHAYGQPGLTLGALYLLPILGVFVAVIRFRVPFWKSCGAMVAAHFLALCGVYALLQRWVGGDLYAAAGQAAVDALKSSDMGDALLYRLYTMGFIDLPGELADSAVIPTLLSYGYQLTDAAKEDLLLSVNTLVSETLVTLTPSVLVSQSILGGVGCLLIPLRFGFLAEEKRAFLAHQGAEQPEGQIRFPDLGMPPFSTWYLPRGIGWQVVAALAAGYLLRRSAAPMAAVAGSALYAGASAVLSIQGAAMLNFLQKSKGTPRVWRVIAPLALLAASVLQLIGIFDQAMNIRGLRKPREPKEGI